MKLTEKLMRIVGAAIVVAMIASLTSNAGIVSMSGATRGSLVTSSSSSSSSSGGGAAFVEPARYALEITAPRAALPAGHRMLVQYPGIPYNVKVQAIHGAWPHTCELTANVPSGMVIDEHTCIVTWSNPTSGTHSDITVEVCDAAADCEQADWDLVVGTSGHFFIDNVTGDDGNGCTFAAPCETIDRAYDVVTANSTLWIKGGGDPYTLAGLTPTGGTTNPMEWKVFWSSASRSTKFIGYGDEKPVIDFEHDGTYCINPLTCTGMKPTARFTLQHDTSYVDWIVVRRAFIQAFQMEEDTANAQGWVVRRVDFQEIGPGFDGSNAAGVMSTRVQAGAACRYGSYFGENTVADTISNPGTTAPSDMVKLYGECSVLVANNSGTEGSGVFFTDGVLAIKGSPLSNVDVRENEFSAYGTAIGGNQANMTDAEIRFNFVTANGTRPSTNEVAEAFYTNQGPGPITNIQIYRNTFVGRVRVKINDPQSSDGPYTFTRNVLVNDDQGQLTPHICDGSTSAAGWTDCNGLINPAGIVDSGNNLKRQFSATPIDSNGELVGTDLTNYGPTTATPRGWQYAYRRRRRPRARVHGGFRLAA